MALLNLVNEAEAKFRLTNDKISSLRHKLEDILFRAQKIANQIKLTGKSKDVTFPDDLVFYRREAKTFIQDFGFLVQHVGRMERECSSNDDVYDERAVKPAQGVMHLAPELYQNALAWSGQAHLLHQALQDPKIKIQCWYMVREIEDVAELCKNFASLMNRVVIAVSTPPKNPGTPPPGPPA